MFSIHARPGWYLPERKATPESLYRNRRAFLRELGFAGMGLAGLAGIRNANAQDAAAVPQAVADIPLPEFKRNPAFADAGRPITDQKYPENFNNFYEFGFTKELPAQRSQGFNLDPYTIEIDGLVEKPLKLDIEQIEKLGVEERVYRFRCVEAWSMTVPWIGVPLHKVLKQVEIKPEAKFVAFTTFHDPEKAFGQREKVYDWPYKEGLRLDEAMNELTMAVTGLYGKRLLPQNGTPLRIITPWKYGYKGPKSIVKISLVAEQPPTLWSTAIPEEYKLYSNVDPDVPHPRWSQASEKQLGDVIVRAETQWYNGYGEYVANLYKDMPRTLY